MTVELFGMARELTGAAVVELALAEPTTRAGLIGALARAYPQLLDGVIDAAGGELVPPNLLLLDGRRAPGPDAPIRDEDKPCVLFLASGG